MPGARFSISRRVALGGAFGWLATRAIACVDAVGAPSTATDIDETEPESASAPLEAGVPPATPDANGANSDASAPNDAASAVDGGDATTAFVILYDTYAQALYLDGTYGPKTGIIRVVDVAAGTNKVYDFWHGHGGQLHRFTLTASHFATLKQKLRVTVTTTVVDGHQHTLFVDPVDPMWRVPGAQPVQVPL